jgi:hypothetical protein
LNERDSEMRILVRIVAALVCLGVVVACDDASVDPPPIDNSPIVLDKHPVDSSSVDAIWGQLDDASVYVQFDDPQGVADLSTALVDIEDVIVIGTIGRDYRGPADMGGICNNTGAEYGSTLPFDLNAMIPASLGGISDMVVGHVDGLVDLSGILCFSEWCATAFLQAGLLTTEAEVLGPSVEGGCTTSIALVGVYPPLRDPVSDIIITRLELEFINVSVTVVDSSGNSVTATWPSLRINYSHPAEMP